MRRTLLILAIALGCGCSKRGANGGFGGSTHVEPDTRPAFVLDASKPFVIEFGRGSGQEGLGVVKVTETGEVALHRIADGARIESASLRLSDAQVRELTSVVNSSQLTRMGRSYSTDIQDGTQWVLWIQQSPLEKSIYFNNAFPQDITAFADRLDAMLQQAGLSAASWTAVPEKQGRDEQDALWARIQPPG